EAGIRHYEIQKRYIRPDGSIRWADLLVVPMFNEGEIPPTHMAIVQDITERKQAEEALQKREESQKLILESYRNFVARSSEGIFPQDLDVPISVDLPEDDLVHHILHDSYMAECNDAMARMYGLTSAQEFLGKRLTEILVVDDPLNIQLTRDYIRSSFRVVD